MTRLIRRLTALACIAALAFAQLVVSAYACPGSAAMQAMAASMADEPGGCDEMANANLCEQHCDYGSASIGFAMLAVPALPACNAALRMQAPIEPAANESIDRQFLQSHPPPSLILFGVLRI